jgi:single stranded DNA-binding protein
LPASVKIKQMYTNLMLCGRIGKQPESRQFGDKTVWSFSVATSRSRKKPDGSWEDLTDWHNCQYWGNLNQRAGKGALIVCSGSLESYKTDAGDTRWQVSVRDIRVLNSGGSEPAANPVDTLSEKFGEVKTVPMPAAGAAANNAAASNNSQQKPQNDDELPF